MTAVERTRQWRRGQKEKGLCERCTKPVKIRRDGKRMSLCAEHLVILAQRNRDIRRGYRPQSTRSVITKDMLLHDLRCVAERLRARRVSMPLYEREGSFHPTSLMRRLKARWSDVCVEAGLLPTYRGCRGVDEFSCRCGRVAPVYLGREQDQCCECRKSKRKRKTEYGRLDVVA